MQIAQTNPNAQYPYGRMGLKQALTLTQGDLEGLTLMHSEFRLTQREQEQAVALWVALCAPQGPEDLARVQHEARNDPPLCVALLRPADEFIAWWLSPGCEWELFTSHEADPTEQWGANVLRRAEAAMNALGSRAATARMNIKAIPA